MKKLVSFLSFVSISLSAQVAWVNEFHYDNVGGDVGEFFEVFVASGTSASDITLTLYEGGDTEVYGAVGGYNIGTDFTAGFNNGLGTFYSKSDFSTTIQQGPDGWTLSGSGLTTQFFSYEGTFTGTGGPADGLTSTDIGVSESGSTVVGAALGLTGTGSTLADFSWSVIGDDTPGSVNVGQTFTGGAIPEPSTYALIFGGLALGFVAWRKRYRKV